MGKKGEKKRKNISDDEEEVDVELEAEMAAVMAMRAEQQGQKTNSDEAQSHEVNSSRMPYNADGLQKCLEDINENLPFSETMVVDDFQLTVQNENDDIEREMAFYNQTMVAMQAGRSKMEILSIPTRRPHDYFCEHVKSDAHMAKIKDRLLVEEKRIEAFEMRKNREQNKKFNKQLSEIKKQEKAAKQKQSISDIENFRKGKSDGDPGRRMSNIVNGAAPEKSKKRKAMDKKYGFGGRDRKMAKITDKKSLNDLTEFNPRGGKFVRRSRAGSSGVGAGKKKNAGKRPGKEARNKQRAARKAST